MTELCAMGPYVEDGNGARKYIDSRGGPGDDPELRGYYPAARGADDTGQDEVPTREDLGVAAGLVRRARAANSDDEVDAARDAIAREIATERSLAARPSADMETLRRVEALAHRWSVEENDSTPELYNALRGA